jgi:hypothetical protein
MGMSNSTLGLAWENCFGKLAVGKLAVGKVAVTVKTKRLLDLGFLCKLRTEYRMSNPQCAEFLGFSAGLIRYRCKRMGLNAAHK